ncbi:hypothetical protein Tco_0883673 [Tanacetum coccineum]
MMAEIQDVHMFKRKSLRVPMFRMMLEKFREFYEPHLQELLQMFSVTTVVRKVIMLVIVQSQEFRIQEIDELSANICLMARIQPTNIDSDAGSSYDSAFLSEVHTPSTNYVNPLFAKKNFEQKYPMQPNIINNTTGDDQIDSNIIFDDPNDDDNNSSVKDDNNAHQADVAERQRMAQVHQAAQGFTDDEWDDILARVAADKDFVQQLQAGEKVSDEDLPRKLVELVNQRKKFFAQQRAEAKRNKPMTPAQQKEYMSTYIKNQEGGYTLKQLKALSFEEVKEIFEATMRKVQSFVPMDSELEVQRLKRAGQDVVEEPVKKQRTEEASGSVQEQTSEEPKAEELSQEQLHQMIMIIRVGGHTEAYQTFDDMLKKFDRYDLDKLWNLVKEIFRTTEPTKDKARELWVELKRLFEPDDNDTLWKLQRYMHDPLKWWLYDTCGIHHVSTERGHDIYMLVEKDYPLSKALATLMMCNKLRVDQYSDMVDELL